MGPNTPEKRKSVVRERERKSGGFEFGGGWHPKSAYLIPWIYLLFPFFSPP
jgi:hypothetical protein